ncbi:Exoribonuclease phosphorolytic domain 2 [Penicillium malachiteum]|uniref:Exoribonuclease phosphorolytic domain 2 n=1 Tax=Penicillium malachiteum TaxID=1324776 RepID=UPI002546E38F|nr:Exoribonuclease phosphorolytic domain 2 [Penicillium malachiteum]KAJ5721469.1 Exoribonuclease phosphorolytic domain 2 [Penicillium malachiteum]
MAAPIASISNAFRADGSASYKCPITGYRVLAAVNAPVELPARKGALKPQEATVEVSIRPGKLSPSVVEKSAESILRRMLSSVILRRQAGYPRRGVVITLAVVEGEPVGRTGTYLPLMPALLHSSLLALLSAAVPLSCTFLTLFFAVTRSGEIVRDPSPATTKDAESLHVISFSSTGRTLMDLVEGPCDLEIWATIRQQAKDIYQGAAVPGPDGDISMDEESSNAPGGIIRETVEDRLRRDYRWEFETL